MIEKRCTEAEWGALAKGLLDRGRPDLAAMMLQADGITSFTDKGVTHRSPLARGYQTKVAAPAKTAHLAVPVSSAPAAPPASPPPAHKSPMTPPAAIDFLDELVEDAANDTEPSYSAPSAPSAEAMARARAAHPNATNQLFVTERARKIEKDDAARHAAALHERHLSEALERRSRLLTDGERTPNSAATGLDERGFEMLVDPAASGGGFEDLCDMNDEGDDNDDDL